MKNNRSKVNVEISADISCKIEIELNFSKNLTVTVTPKKAAKLSFTSILKFAVPAIVALLSLLQKWCFS